MQSNKTKNTNMLTGLIMLFVVVGTLEAQMSKYPCAFIDTVNITGSYPHELISNDSTISSNNNTSIVAKKATNISYIYQWMVVPPELTAVYDFVIDNGVRIPTEKHLRACICKMKPCIRFCCQPGFYYDLQNKSCSSITTSLDTNLNQSSMYVRFRNDSQLAVATSQHFMVHHGVPCENMRIILKDRRQVQWTLYENGTIAHRNTLFSKHYCYTVLPERDQRDSTSDITWHWQPLACLPEKLPFVLGVREWTYAICLIITVICMILILFVYLLCTELRNTFYGVAIKSYTLCIIIGYSLLAHLTLTNPTEMSKYACSRIPVFALLYIILSFYILSFISLNFYLSFFGIILSKLMFWFIFFPIVLVTVCWSFFVSFDYYGNKPVFGNDTCWFDPRNCSIVVYLYVPILLACICSGIFFILSVLRMNEEIDSDTCINKLIAVVSRNRFKSFWKFFSYTLISWSVCMCSFTINYYRGEKTHINYVVCLFIAFHGFGSLYALIGKNNQIQNFLRRIEDDVDTEDIAEISVPMTPY